MALKVFEMQEKYLTKTYINLSHYLSILYYI